MLEGSGTAGQRSPGARRDSSTDGPDLTNLPRTKKRASFDVEFYGQLEGATSPGGGHNPGITGRVYVSGGTGQGGQCLAQNQNQAQTQAHTE